MVISACIFPLKFVGCIELTFSFSYGSLLGYAKLIISFWLAHAPFFAYKPTYFLTFTPLILVVTIGGYNIMRQTRSSSSQPLYSCKILIKNSFVS